MKEFKNVSTQAAEMSVMQSVKASKLDECSSIYGTAATEDTKLADLKAQVARRRYAIATAAKANAYGMSIATTVVASWYKRTTKCTNEEALNLVATYVAETAKNNLLVLTTANEIVRLARDTWNSIASANTVKTATYTATTCNTVRKYYAKFVAAMPDANTAFDALCAMYDTIPAKDIAQIVGYVMKK